jgi:menaquinone-dependent protoporphyrinogen oxidase
MSRILIVYGTTEGHTKEIAERLATAIEAEGSDVRLCNAESASGPEVTENIDGVLVGGSVHLGQYQASLREFVQRNRDLLTRVPSAFFSVSLLAADSGEGAANEIEAIQQRFFRKTGWRSRRVENFAGALLYTRYNVFIRQVFKLIVKSRGRAETDTSRDYDLTDWPAVDRFAREFSLSIAGATNAQTAA